MVDKSFSIQSSSDYGRSGPMIPSSFSGKLVNPPQPSLEAAHATTTASSDAKPVKTIDKHSSEYVIRSGIAGGVAGSAAKTLIAPLDRIKILFQTSNPEFLPYRGSFLGLFRAGGKIWQTDGFYGLFQGHSVTLLRIFPYASIKFVAYEQIRSLLIPNDSYETAARRFMAGSLSGLASVFFTYPLDLIRVRLAFETRNLSHHTHDHSRFISHHRGRVFSIIKDVFNEHPPQKLNDPAWLKYLRHTLPQFMVSASNFYRGFAPTIIGMIPYAGVSFYTHDTIQDLFRSKLLSPYTMPDTLVSPNSIQVVKKTKDKEHKNSRDARAPLRAYAQLIAGGFAGMASQTAAYPFEVVRRRMQVSGAIDQGKFLSFKDAVRLIFRESGFRGFFVGLSIGYMKVVPMVACSFYVYERTKILLGI